MKRNILFFSLMGTLVLSTAACQPQKNNQTNNSTAFVVSTDNISDSSTAADTSYRQITQEEAARMMETETGYIILDVRTQQEYDEGHIPHAICIPNETISDSVLAALPDPSQMIFVYCRSGRRSKEAAEKLASFGYTNIIEFGGIITWTGPITLN